MYKEKEQIFRVHSLRRREGYRAYIYIYIYMRIPSEMVVFEFRVSTMQLLVEHLFFQTRSPIDTPGFQDAVCEVIIERPQC